MLENNYSRNDTKKRIAFFGIKYFPSRGGTSRVAENLILNLAAHYEVSIYCYKNKLAKQHIPGVSIIELPDFKMGSFGVFMYYLLCYFHILLFGKYDIVHAHKIDSFLFLPWFSKKIKVIATAHEAPYKRDKWSGLAKRFFKISEDRFLKFEGIKTAISKPLCDFYKDEYNVDVKFIANGINLSDKRSINGFVDFWPKSVPESTPFVFFAARRIMGTKGLHTMLEAYKRIDFKGTIFIAGELDNYPNYIKKIKELSEGLNVHFLGFVNPLSTLLEYVHKCDYFVFPSETEGMSIMLLEVASTGKPILASDIPENTQVFDGNEVLYFRNKDVTDLIDKINWLTKNKVEFSALGENAARKVASHYTWNNITTEYMALYEEALNKQ